MKAIILAGGRGTRLRPVTYEIPKPLVPVKKRPIVNHLIEFFRRHGVEDIGILASRDHEEDFRRWQKVWDDEVVKGITMFHEETPRGTFGGLEPLREWLGGERFILSNGDELKDFDLAAMERFHGAQGGTGTIALVEVPNPSEYGVPVMDGHHIKQFLEKPKEPPSNFISSGLYMLEPEVFKHADFNQPIVTIEHDIFPKLAAEGKLYGFKPPNARWYDCGTLERWERAIKEW